MLVLGIAYLDDKASIVVDCALHFFVFFANFRLKALILKLKRVFLDVAATYLDHRFAQINFELFAATIKSFFNENCVAAYF